MTTADPIICQNFFENRIFPSLPHRIGKGYFIEKIYIECLRNPDRRNRYKQDQDKDTHYQQDQDTCQQSRHDNKRKECNQRIKTKPDNPG